MNEPNLPPNSRALDVHLDLLRVSMTPEEYELLLGLVAPVLRAIEEEDPAPVGFGLNDDEAESVPDEIRDEAALVVATAVTGRLDNQLIQIDVEDCGPVRIVTDAATAADPERCQDIADCIRERYRQDEELRGIAEASGLPTDL
ncbi:hypothetical protein [Streptomyces poonensis]|uniref:Uncharacterized protein n=1 Tax=Streptomyces poonensis TaxID=68255 RepID=A0A918PCS0_9ACTN|nr:hypothetical protein [Streptomyces poonensis]GGZ00426.1 hypothetical protein GCM10010365_19020 [Streptomyces poonensis]GLJ93742.1 hypothetical protein GCM10017589_63580 [Streptomyces poonensis]